METSNSITGGTFWGPVVQGGTVILPPPPVRPSGLPARGLFVGREPLLGELVAALGGGGDGPPVSAVAGLGGVGKTALAVEAAHRVGHLFPGGVLFVDLRGYDERPVTPEQALDTLLRALGEDVPPGLPARQHLYRSRLAAAPGPVLLVADNASSPAQVTPLLPGDPRHRVLVTSRHALSDRTLAPRHFPLDALPEQESVALLTELAGRPHPALAEIARQCGHLPLALRISGALLADQPPDRVAGRLADSRRRLRALDDGAGPAVRAAFALSHRRLSRAEARLFALLALHPGPDLAPPAAAALADLPEGAAHDLLRSLARAHLMEGDGLRYRFHDLVGLYAAEQRVRRPEDARRRLVAHYRGELAAIGAGRPPYTTGRHVRAWLLAEHANLFALVPLAQEFDGPAGGAALAAAFGELGVQIAARQVAVVADGLTAAAGAVLLGVERGAAAAERLDGLSAMLEDAVGQLDRPPLGFLRTGYRESALLLAGQVRELFGPVRRMAAGSGPAAAELAALETGVAALASAAARLDDPPVRGLFRAAAAGLHMVRGRPAAEVGELTLAVEEIRTDPTDRALPFVEQRLAMALARERGGNAKGATGGR